MIELSIKRPLIVFVLFSIIALLGLVTFRLLNINLLPKFETNVITISTIYPGASASEVETSVTKKIEDAVSSLENIDRLRSTSQEGFEATVIELKSGADPNLALQDAQRKVNAIMADLPTDVKSPTISKLSMDEMPILQIAATSEMKPTMFYKLVEDQIQPRLSKLKGVGQISLIGGTKREIKVNIDQNKLKAYNISILQALLAIQKANMDYPTGKVEESSKQYTVRLAAKYTSIDQLKNTAIITNNDRSKVLVTDVAEVEDGTEEQTKIDRLNGKTSIGLQIQKQSDANTVEVCKEIKEELNTLENEYASNKLKFNIASDNSTYTMESVNSVVKDLLLAVLIVSFVCFIFLHSVRSALIVMVAVPLSMLPSFIFMYMFGYSLNLMSLMSLSLAVGILVDDSIVVVENIFRHLEMGKSKREAALAGSKQIFFTATSITLVIVSVFLPLAITGGIIGNILKEFAVPLIVSTMASLLVSFTLTPLLLSEFGKLEDITNNTLASRFSRRVEKSFILLKNLYSKTLEWSLDNRKKVYLGVIILFIVSISFYPLGLIGAAFIPDTDQGEFVIDLEMAPQISIYENNMLTKRVEDILLSKPEVTKVMTNVGVSSGTASTTSRNNIAQIVVSIIDKSKRKTGVQDYSEKIKNELLKEIPGIKVRTSPTSLTGSASEAPIQFVVKGTDINKVDSTAAIVKNIIKNTPGTTDVRYSIDDPKPEIHIQINRSKMEELGLSVADVGATLRTALAGNTDSKYQDGAYEYDINIAFDKFDRKNIFDVAGITFVNNHGELIELNQFADITQSMGPSMLERNDRMSSITINSNLAGRPSGTVGSEIEEALKGKIPEGVTVSPAGTLKYQGNAFSSLGIAMIAAIVLVYLIMVALYNSLLHPFVVTFAIPVAMIGSFLALALTMENLTIFAIIGLITLMGLVVKNAILLVDFTNNLIKEGKDIKEGLMEAGRERLRPILMTTLAMVFGMLPLAIASGAGAEMKNGMAWVIIGGLLSSLALTLLLVPCIYYSVETMRKNILARRSYTKTNKLIQDSI
jgi:HAE1 family hydrophobic/amphiphilic exporter-1